MGWPGGTLGPQEAPKGASLGSLGLPWEPHGASKGLHGSPLEAPMNFSFFLCAHKKNEKNKVRPDLIFSSFLLCATKKMKK